MLYSAIMDSRTRHRTFGASGGLYPYVESEVLRANSGIGEVSVDDRDYSQLLPNPFVSILNGRNLVSMGPTLSLIILLVSQRSEWASRRGDRSQSG